MINFITNRTIHKVKENENIQIFSEELFFLIRNLQDLIESEIIALDTETNGLDAYMNKVLLVIVGNKENQFVIDWTCTDLISYILNQKRMFIGHNLKFDYKMIKKSYNIELNELYDTMIAEQRLSQNYKSKKYRGYISFSLEAVIKKRLKLFENGMGKQIRKEFIGKDPDTFQFENKHILYAAGDIKYLFDIKDLQEKNIKEANQRFLIYDIEFPLIKILAESELEGWILNETKWIELCNNNKEKRFDLEVLLDEKLRMLRDTLLTNEDKIFLKTGRFDRIRTKKVETVSYDLFGELINDEKGKKADDKRMAFINYSSPTELINILGRLKQPVPTKSGEAVIPTFIKSKTNKYIVDKSLHSFTTGAGAIENYLAEHPESKIKEFILALIEYREICTRINTFGESFITKFKNPISKKVHTIFRQANTSTGRLQSGSKRKKEVKKKKEEDFEQQENYFNSQNIPAEKDYRECFTVEEGYSIVSSDYSGCEAVVMIDKAKDEKFYEFAIKNDDAHSPLCQAVWRAIGQFRNDPVLSNIVISKKQNKNLRDGFKANTFGVCYGMGVKKYGKTLRISEKESKIGLKVQKSMTPKTFKYLDSIAKQAVSQGYIVINSRTNSRVWYIEVLETYKNKSSLENSVRYDIESSAKNITIQGTNADIIKEAMVELTREFKKRNLDAMVMGSVHDEIIVKFNDKIHLIETHVKGELLPLNMGEFVKHIMEDVANRYLSFIEMKAEASIQKTWTK